MPKYADMLRVNAPIHPEPAPRSWLTDERILLTLVTKEKGTQQTTAYQWTLTTVLVERYAEAKAGTERPTENGKTSR